MFKLLKILIYLFLISNASSASAPSNQSHWCTTKRCGSKHIACKFQNTYSHNCRHGAQIIPIHRYRKLILLMFNNFRNKVASSKFDDFFLAGRMAKMVWSHQLEYLAEVNVKQCDVTQKRCMASKEFSYVGQNSESFRYRGYNDSFSNNEIIRTILDNWFDLLKFIDRDNCLYVPEVFRNPDAGKAAIAIAEKNTHIGCAGLRYSVGFLHYFQFTCAFATETFVHQPLYHAATAPGLRCKRKDKEYKNLCDVTEKYVNDAYNPKAVIYGEGA